MAVLGSFMSSKMQGLFKRKARPLPAIYAFWMSEVFKTQYLAIAVLAGREGVLERRLLAIVVAFVVGADLADLARHLDFAQRSGVTVVVVDAGDTEDRALGRDAVDDDLAWQTGGVAVAVVGSVACRVYR